MPNDLSPQYLRPEAQPIFDWSRMTECQQEGLERLVGMLHEALARPDETPHPKMRWLFKETRTQLAFINGIRGTGKTSLMVTMAAAIDAPRQFVATDHGDDNSPRFKDLKKQIEELRDRIICVQPLEMEGLPDNTPLLAAILARVYRTAKEYGSAGSARGFLMDDPSDSREITYFRQYLHRVAQALDSNLASRKGQLDPEQFGEAVMQEEDQRLTLPSDLEDVLRKLAMGILDESASDPLDKRSQSEKQNKKRRLFLIPIDDIDLNPRRCLELLRLLRTFSPPRELFFLLMGQFEMVEAIVKLQMSADFGKIQKEGGSLLGVDEQELTKKLEEISTANVRKMIPPHNRIRLRDLTIKEVLNFYPLNVAKPRDSEWNPWQLRTLLDKTRLYTQKGSEARFRTLGELLHPGDANWDRMDQPDEQKEIRDLSWIDYCGLGIFQVPARRLADAWMELQTLSSEHEKVSEQEGHRKSLARKTLKLMEEMIERVIEADPQLLESQQNRLKDGPAPNCIPFVEAYPTFDRDLAVLNGGVEVPLISDDAAQSESSTRLIVYQPRLRLRALKAESAVPLFEIPGEAGTIKTLQTRAALAVRNDLRELYDADTHTLADFAECTSERPVAMSWVGPEGEVATFPWPIPPLPTYAETSRFLRRWQALSEEYLGPVDSRISDETKSRMPLDELLRAMLKSGGPPAATSEVISPNRVADLTLLWVWLSMEELEASLAPTLKLAELSEHPVIKEFSSLVHPVLNPTREFQTGPWSPTDGVQNAAWQCIIDRSLELRRRAIASSMGRTWGQIDKWLRRIARIVQPEYVGFEVSDHLMERMETISKGNSYSEGESLQVIYQNVFLILEHQRTERLQPLWTNGKLQLWRALNRGVDHLKLGPHWMLSVVAEPMPESKSEVGQAIADIRREVGQFREDMRDESDRQNIRNLLSQAKSFASGTPESAMRLIVDAEVQTERLYRRKPGDAAIIRELANGIEGLTEQLMLPENKEVALKKIVDLRQRVFNLDSRNETDAVSMSSSAVALATHYDNQSAWDNAALVLKTVNDQLHEFLVRFPASKNVQRQILVVNGLLASNAISQERWKEAEVYASASLKISRELLTANPGSISAKRDLSVSMNTCADVAMRQGRWAEAEAYANEDLKISRELLAASPEGPQAKHDMSVSLIRCVDVALRLGRWKDAETFASESAIIRRELLEVSPDSSRAKRDLSVSISKCTEVAMHQERWKDALAYASECVTIRRELLKALPESPQAKRDLSVALERLQAVAARNGEQRAAIHWARESVELMEAAAQLTAADSFGVRSDLVELTMTLAERHSDVGAHATAKKLLQKMLPEAEHLANDERGGAYNRLSFARCLALLARQTTNRREKAGLQREAWERFAAEQRQEVRFHLELRGVFEELRQIFDPKSEPLLPKTTKETSPRRKSTPKRKGAPIKRTRTKGTAKKGTVQVKVKRTKKA